MDITLTIDSSPIALTIGSASGAIGPAPGGTGLVSVTAGVLDTPTTLSARVAADATNLRNQLGLGTAATTAATAYATAAQGATADSAVQPGDLGDSAGLDVGTTAGTVAAGDDSRFEGERVPTAVGLTDKFSTNKASIVDDDRVAILDSAASNAPKHSLWSLVKSTLKTYFDTLYALASHTQAASTISDSTTTGRALLTAVNASAARTTLELGAASILAISTGGNGVSDEGKAVIFGEDGAIASSGSFFLIGPYPATTKAENLTDLRTYQEPNANGVKALTDNTSGIPDNLVTANTKTTPIDADSVLMTDSAVAGTPAKRLTFANLWTWIKGNIESAALTLTNLVVTNYTESVVSIGTVTTSNTLALTNGTRQRVRLTASTACTFTMPTATDGKSFVLEVEQAATTGLGTATFTGVDWGAAGAPTITPTAGKMDIITFMANGTKWFGAYRQGYTY